MGYFICTKCFELCYTVQGESVQIFSRYILCRFCIHNLLFEPEKYGETVREQKEQVRKRGREEEEEDVLEKYFKRKNKKTKSPNGEYSVGEHWIHGYVRGPNPT